ncbi:MAG: ThiF family adenylyltransferase [Candidatus Geothermarchaeales archaeon]
MPEKAEFKKEEYYARQLVLTDLGKEGQRKLEESKMVVVGLGGLGSIVTLYLALAGVGHLRLIDQDTVELNNLHRQVLFSTDDLRRPKAEVAGKKISKINPNVSLDVLVENVNEDNVREILSGVDVVVDGLDNMRTRYLVNKVCVEQEVPYVFAGAIGLEGNVTVFSPPETPCLECVFGGLDDAYLPTCETRGILGVTAGTIGLIEATEAIKLITGIGETLKGKLLFCNLRDMTFDIFDIVKRPDCPICSATKEEAIKVAVAKTSKTTWLCGRNTVNVNPPKPMDIMMDEIYPLIKNRYKVVAKSALAIIFDFEGFEVSLFKNGRMLIKNVQDEEEAINVYNKVLNRLKPQ